MSNMYEKVQKNRRPRWNRTVYIWGAVALVITVAVLTPIIYLASHQYRFHRFLQDISKSSVLIKDETVKCYVGGKTGTMTNEDLSGLLMLLSDGGCGRSETKLPPERPVRIEFPNGASLELWKARTKDAYTKEIIPSLFVSYVDQNGNRFSYITHKLSVSYLTSVLPDEAREWIARNSEP